MSDLIDIQDVIDLLLMNREEEYKKSLSAECEHKSVIRSKHDAHVAFCDYLIECVKQLPTRPTPSNTLGALDCVERQAVIDVLNRGLSKIPYVNNTDTEMIRRDERMCCIQEIRELPSAQPERKKGELVLQSDDYHEYYECDQCGIAVGLDDVRNFCCNCGADMRGDNNDS